MPKWAIALSVVGSALVVLVVVLVVVAWLAAGASMPPHAVIVRGRNMAPTLMPGDRILVNAGGRPERGAIVVFEDPTHQYSGLIGRIIATEGQTIELGKDGAVRIDGSLAIEPYVDHRPTYPLDSAVTYPLKVPTGCVWIMGDNRPDSGDSREYGPVTVNDIIGVAAVRWWPLARLARFSDGN